jgi:cathepsin A (carboxypeptidase C)
MQAQIAPCLALVNKCNTPMHDSRFDTLACKSALTYCEAALSDPWTDTGMSAYDWSHMGDYEQEEWVAAFLNDPKTHKALGIDKRGAGDKHDGVFIGCSDAVYKHFASTGDGAKDTTWASECRQADPPSSD